MPKPIRVDANVHGGSSGGIGRGGCVVLGRDKALIASPNTELWAAVILLRQWGVR